MTARRPRPHPGLAVVAALLAMIAVLSMSALAGWHAAAVHDDRPAISGVVPLHTDAGHTDAGRDDADSAVHVAAHAIGHGLAIPVGATAPYRPAAAGQDWIAGHSIARTDTGPIGLLRPPQG